MQFAREAINLLDLITKMLLTMCKNTFVKEIMIYNIIIDNCLLLSVCKGNKKTWNKQIFHVK